MKKIKKENLIKLISQLVISIMIFNLGAIGASAASNIPKYGDKLKNENFYMMKYKNKILAQNGWSLSGFYEINENGKTTYLGDEVNEILGYSLSISKVTGKSTVDILSGRDEPLKQLDFNTNKVTTLSRDLNLRNKIINNIKTKFNLSSDIVVDLMSRDDNGIWAYYYYITGTGEQHGGMYNIKTNSIWESNENRWINSVFVKSDYSYMTTYSGYYPNIGNYKVIKIENSTNKSQEFSIETNNDWFFVNNVANNGKTLIAEDGIYELSGTTYKKVVDITDSNRNTSRKNNDIQIQVNNVGEFKFLSKDSSLLKDSYSSRMVGKETYSVDVNDNLWRLITKNGARYIEKYESGKFITKYEVDANAQYLDVYNDDSMVVTNFKDQWYTSIDRNLEQKEFTNYTVSPVRTTSTKITGKGLSGATVEAYIGSKKIGSATVNSSGNYTINISKQKSGVTITVKMSKSGYKTVQKNISVMNVSLSPKKTLTKDIYKYDAGKGKYLTYINGKGYSQFIYLNKSGNYAFTPSSWMSAAGLTISMPTSSNGYTMAIDNNYIGLYNNAKSLLESAKSGELSKEEVSSKLKTLELGSEEVSPIVESKAAPKKTLTKDIYKYDAGSKKGLTYINGKLYSQFIYLNKSGNYAFTPSSWMSASGLTVTMPTSKNGYVMKINNPYISKYNNTVKEIEAYIEQ